MTRPELIRAIVECLRAFAVGKEPAEITERTDPIRTLGCSSHDGVDFACDLSVRLKLDIPHTFNPFVDDNRNSSRSVGEIADALLTIIKDKKEGGHGN